MRGRRRNRRKKHQKILPWPEDEDPPEAVAERSSYVGSPEHKGHWSSLFEPRLRSDASKCPKELSDMDELTVALREGIRGGCVGGGFEDGFPRYVWVFLNGELWEARHIRGPVGTYKGYGPLEEVEYPTDPENRLTRAEEVSE